MGAAQGAIAASLASTGLSAFASIKRGEGTQAADEFQAAKAERAAQFGRAQADITDSVMRERLNTTLANIDVIRGATHTDPTSPTGSNVAEYNRMLAERQRLAAVTSIRGQAAEDEASAKYLREAGKYALTQGYISAGIDVFSGAAKAFQLQMQEGKSGQ
jgi:hypothetical protein